MTPLTGCICPGQDRSLGEAQMLKCNGQISLITAQRFYWPPATPDVLTFPADSEKRAEHRAEFREFVDGGQVQVRPRLPHDVPILDQLGLRPAAVVASAGNPRPRGIPRNR